LGSFGSGISDLLREEPLPSVREEGLAADADTTALRDRLPVRALRQMDRFTRMALLCLLNALDDANTNPEAGLPDTGIILATGYGPATPTFAFLDSLLTHGEQLASPLSFSHSVHNIPAASLAMQFGLTGPCMTFCQLDNPVAAGFLTAEQWLGEGRVRRVLFGAVDEHTPLLARTSRQIAAKRVGRPPSGTGLRATLPISEGAAFFCVGPAGETGRRGQIEDIFLQRGGSLDDLPKGADGLCPPQAWGRAEGSCPPAEFKDETVFLSGAIPPAMAAAPGRLHLGKIYGNVPVAQAFDIVFALASRQCAPAGSALCCSRGSHGETACIRVRQPESQGDAP
jgi:3-oxoacyl-[acyl-carrier-protein] synthase II